MDSCLSCHFGVLSGASHETDAWAVLLVLLFQHDSNLWVGNFQGLSWKLKPPIAPK